MVKGRGMCGQLSTRDGTPSDDSCPTTLSPHLLPPHLPGQLDCLGRAGHQVPRTLPQVGRHWAPQHLGRDAGWAVGRQAGQCARGTREQRKQGCGGEPRACMRKEGQRGE